MVQKGPFLELKFSVFFFQNWKTQLSKTFVIYVLAFDPIKIWTLYASQNDYRNLSFVKDINAVGNKMTRNGCDMTISKSCLFFNRTDFSFLPFMYCDLWPYVLWPLDFQIQKRIVSAEYIWGNTVSEQSFTANDVPDMTILIN